MAFYRRPSRLRLRDLWVPCPYSLCPSRSTTQTSLQTIPSTFQRIRGIFINLLIKCSRLVNTSLMLLLTLLVSGPWIGTFNYPSTIYLNLSILNRSYFKYPVLLLNFANFQRWNSLLSLVPAADRNNCMQARHFSILEAGREGKWRCGECGHRHVLWSRINAV